MNELFEKILYRALQKNATDIHLTLKESLIIRFRILGELEFYDEIDLENGTKFMNYLKYKSSINTNYRLLPQTGQFHLFIIHRKIYLRVSFLPSIDFESIVVRILNNHESITIDDITPLEEIGYILKRLPNIDSGLFIISGPTGSGKSTTLYTILDEIIATKKKNIITIEDPIEIRKPECLQIELNEKLGITYHNTLRQILRHDPDVIMIGEIRDQDTAQIALTCALTGHLVLTTIHASSAYLALKRLENLGISQLDLQDVVIGSLSQRIKYDRINSKVVILPELMSQKQIQNYFNNHVIDYHTFHDNAQVLIEKHGYSEDLFKGEAYG